MPAARIAVVDLGTNSTRLLIADTDDGKLTELERRSAVTRLGDGVDSTGRLSPAAIDRVFAVLADYRKLIDEHQAHTVLAVATSAVRDASNGEEFRAVLEERFGIAARIVSGDEEARLTFRGATANRAAPPDSDTAPSRASTGLRETLVIDIGGGSTEYVIGVPGSDPDFHVSTRMGSVRHTERHLAHDPPLPEELAALRSEIGQIVRAEAPDHLRDQTATGIAVAGTATTLAAIDLQLELYDSDKVDGHQLAGEACERILNDLAARSTDERRQVIGLHPDRAPTIVAGAAILVESLGAFGLDRIEVAEADILHGSVLSVVDY
jgi:exopolyphosphatase / guanosine-5'-triphosphate,3'-diphosphate pyrophosphatase